jgi:aminoglycoside/choline kinase family phosphotransferase
MRIKGATANAKMKHSTRLSPQLFRMLADARLDALRAWLDRVLPVPAASISPASADASFRRYFRIALTGGVTMRGSSQQARTLIAMDAPPPQEDCRPFVAVAGLLSEAGINAPEVLAGDFDQGFLLLSDLGTRMYFDELTDASAPPLYRDASITLVRWQLASRESALPPYDEAFLARELALFPEWYIARHLGVALDDAQRATISNAFRLILDQALAQPRVYVHRDYHSRNLMVTDPNPGVLDFQGALYGPITYDLVSLLRDAYIAWDEEYVLDWAVRHWERSKEAALPVAADFGDFWRDFEWMGVQRHLKILGIFARLYHRDGKNMYLEDMPRVMAYLRAACTRYRALGPFLNLLDKLEQRQSVVGYSF